MTLKVIRLTDVSLEKSHLLWPSLAEAHCASLCGEGTDHCSFGGPFDYGPLSGSVGGRHGWHSRAPVSLMRRAGPTGHRDGS